MTGGISCLEILVKGFCCLDFTKVNRKPGSDDFLNGGGDEEEAALEDGVHNKIDE